MDRRHFLGALAAGALAAPLRGLAAEAAERERALFSSNPNLTPLRGFAGQDIACDALAIEGSIPAALRGTFYRNGPGLFERGGQRYRHPFDGEIHVRRPFVRVKRGTRRGFSSLLTALSDCTGCAAYFSSTCRKGSSFS